MQRSYPIVKKNNRYLVDLGTHEMVYDAHGHYIGQYQGDSLDGAWPNREIFIGAIDGGIMFRGVVVPIADLTHSELTNLEFVG